MQISSTAMPASSGAWAQSTDQAQGTATADLASALGIPVGEAGEGQSQSSEESEFGGAMAMAELLASSAKAGPKGSPVIGNSLNAQSPKGSSGQKSEGPSIQATGKLDKNIPRGVGGGEEQGSLIQRMAVSSNTGAEIAGLKPWSKDWVLEGGMNRHPAQKTLIPGDARGDTADVTSQLAQLSKLLKDASTESASGSVSTQEQPMTALQQQDPRAQQLLPEQAGLEVEASRQATPRRKSLSGDDFLSLRQAVSGEAGAQSMAEGAAGKNLRVLPGGATPSVGDPAQALQAGKLPAGIKERPLQAGPAKGGLTSPMGNDTLGLIHPEMNGKAAAMGASTLPFAASSGSLKMDGAVVPGSMQRNRLSSESVFGVSQSIRSLTTSGGGEIRIRLKPDHLGELHLKVSSSGKAGNEIGLQIQASDERAKKILEESISSLKESLSGQNLNLSKVDVQVSNALSASSGSGAGQFDSQSGSQNPLNQDLGAMLDQGGRRQFDRGGERAESGRPEGLRSSAGKAFSAPAARTASGTSRLDVMA